ncbi:hypothetical protein DIPPA_17049 [Diplonema papillatum]|nr:hypothetical protein DIPPA_17049 [Diplonema papillatum]KAJ9473692.1 hypothetical protein DIPPA_17049 [Diplonema papillatum]
MLRTTRVSISQCVAAQRRCKGVQTRPGELAEYSVVYSDRALNHMSPTFIDTMQQISASLKRAYTGAATVAVVPGSGTFGMESAARQFATGKKALVIRNGFFSYRWSQILDQGRIASETTVLKARPTSDSAEPQFEPCPIEEVEATIRSQKPDIVFAPHVETSAGMILSDCYIARVAAAAKEVGALFLLDCIASGTSWVDMGALGVDILLSAPQKGWSGPASSGFVMLNERARTLLDSTTSSSFALDLKTWVTVMEKYEQGGHMYHATMPTDSLRGFTTVLRELESFGYEKAKERQALLGQQMREMLKARGYTSIAADSCAAPSVVVCYGKPELVGQLKGCGLQVAGGVPLMVDEPKPFNTFRFGFFGLDKLEDPEAYVQLLDQSLAKCA